MKKSIHKWIYAVLISVINIIMGIVVTKMNGFKQILDLITEQQATYFLVVLGITFLVYYNRFYPKKEIKNEDSKRNLG